MVKRQKLIDVPLPENACKKGERENMRERGGNKENQKRETRRTETRREETKKRKTEVSLDERNFPDKL